VTNSANELTSPPDHSIWTSPEARGAIASRNWGAVFTILRRYGYTQEHISAMTGCSPRDVAATIGGRPLFSHEAQYRVAGALGVPMCLAGFATCAPSCSMTATRRQLAG
jgi:hypothetical protein